MVLAGYPTVIATMRSIKHVDTPLIAKGVYAHLLEGGVPNNRKAAKALQNAVNSLHDKVGESEVARWVVHMGCIGSWGFRGAFYAPTSRVLIDCAARRGVLLKGFNRILQVKEPSTKVQEILFYRR
jgi:hypothetical protein